MIYGSSRVATVLLLATSACVAQSLSMARSLAQEGKVDVAAAELRGSSGDAAAQLLLCKLFASIDERDEAVKTCEAAARLAPDSSEMALALARAYGAKAEHSGALTGMRLVGKIKSNFERAVELDGKSVEALSDLGQFYVEAPAMVGGGIDKAQTLVPRLQALSPARAHRLSAMIAAKQKDDATAEREFRAELGSAATAEAYVDLANFYKSRKEVDQAVDQARLALQRDAKHGPDTLDAAALLIGLKRNAVLAQAALQAYLKAPQQGVAQYARAHALLAQSLADAGDRNGAQSELQAARNLAHTYQPALQGLR